jgi:ATP-binding cassette, subfamily B, bacterial PglK
MQTAFFSNAYTMLNASQKKRGLAVVLLLGLQSLLDFFSIASFLPIIFLIIKPEVIQTNDTLQSLYNHFNFTSSDTFIITLTSLIFLFTLLKGGVSFWINRVKARYIFNIGSELSSRGLSRYLEFGYPGFSETDFSRELNRITTQPIAFANNVILPLANLFSEGLVFIFIVSCIVFYDLRIILMLIVILIPIVVLYALIRRSTKNIGNSIKHKYPLVLKYAQQIVEAFIEIKISGKERFFTNRFNLTNKDLGNALATDHIIQNSVVRLAEIIIVMVVCFLVIYTVLSGHSHQKTILSLSIYAGASFRVIPSINRILLSTFQIRTHGYLLQDLKDLVNFKASEITDTRLQVVFTQQLELKNISFGYPDKQHVLHNTNLTIHKGMKVALTGKSGEGKTTLLLVLLGLINDYQGEILVDNKRVNGHALRSIMGYVPQNPYILDGTILENIAFGLASENIDGPKATQLLDELDLGDFIKQLPHGVDSNIGERGVKLSGGQRQRLAIARALYADAQIFLLDEITNQVHAEAELDIVQMLDRLSRQGKTMIMVTHNLHNKNFFDVIYNLEKGKLQAVTAGV